MLLVQLTAEQGCSLGLGLESFFRTSWSRLGFETLTSRSRLLTPRLHRTSKFKLRTTTIKFSILYRDNWAA